MRPECSNMYMRACICMYAYSADFYQMRRAETRDGKFIHHACNNRKIIFRKCEINFVESMSAPRTSSRIRRAKCFIFIKAHARACYPTKLPPDAYQASLITMTRRDPRRIPPRNRRDYTRRRDGFSFPRKNTVVRRTFIVRYSRRSR